VANSHGEGTRHLDNRAIEAILKFCFADSDEVRARTAEVLPEELLVKLRNFAAGELKRTELEEVSEMIVSNTAAIETLADEIKKRWSHPRRMGA
jgi:hypothetical protein